MRTAQDGSAARPLEPRSPAPRELREPSLEGAQSSRVRRRLRSERGQAAVEFALVVPLLCVADHRDPPLRQGHELLARPEPRRQRGRAQGGGQHVHERRRVRHLDPRAGSRRASSAPAARRRSRTRRRSTSACPRAATSAIRSRCRSPPTTACRSSAPRSRCAAARRCGWSSPPSSRAAERARERRPRIADLAASEDGGILVFVALLIPVVLLFLALQRRHRQLVGAQAAPAAAGRRGRARRRRAPRPVLHRPGAATPRSRPRRPASAAALARATTARSAARTRARSRSSTRARPTPRAAPADDTDDGGALRHGDLDVRRQGERGGPAAHLPDSRPLRRRRDQRARPRGAEAGRDPGGDAARSPFRTCASPTSSRPSSTRHGRRRSAPCS